MISPRVDADRRHLCQAHAARSSAFRSLQGAVRARCPLNPRSSGTGIDQFAHRSRKIPRHLSYFLLACGRRQTGRCQAQDLGRIDRNRPILDVGHLNY